MSKSIKKVSKVKKVIKIDESNKAIMDYRGTYNFVPSFQQFKEELFERTYRYSVQGFLYQIHAGMCNNFGSVDSQFSCMNEKDSAILEKILLEFSNKGFKYETLAQQPIQVPTPTGTCFGTNHIIRFFLKENTTLKMIPVEKENK